MIISSDRPDPAALRSGSSDDDAGQAFQNLVWRQLPDESGDAVDDNAPTRAPQPGSTLPSALIAYCAALSEQSSSEASSVPTDTLDPGSAADQPSLEPDASDASAADLETTGDGSLERDAGSQPILEAAVEADPASVAQSPSAVTQSPSVPAAEGQLPVISDVPGPVRADIGRALGSTPATEDEADLIDQVEAEVVDAAPLATSPDDPAPLPAAGLAAASHGYSLSKRSDRRPVEAIDDGDPRPRSKGEASGPVVHVLTPEPVAKAARPSNAADATPVPVIAEVEPQAPALPKPLAGMDRSPAAADRGQATQPGFAQILTSVRAGSDQTPVVPINLGRAAFSPETQAVVQSHVQPRSQVHPDASELVLRADLAALMAQGATAAIERAPTVATVAPVPDAVIATRPDALIRDLAVGMAADIKAGNRWLDIRLDPEELGRIDVRITVDPKGEVRAVIAADNPATHDLLQRDAGTLVRALQDAGVKTDSSSLSFQLRSDLGGRRQNDASPNRRSADRKPDDDDQAPAAPVIGRGTLI